MEFLSQKGVPFIAKDVSTDEDAQRELIQLGSRSTPTIKVDDEVLIGFSPSKLLAVLKA